MFSHRTVQVNSASTLIHPENMLRGLLAADVSNSNGHDYSDKNKFIEPSSISNLEHVIESLHEKLDCMNHEVLEVESLLNQRDMLFHQLDHLRAERQEIEDEISSESYVMEKSYKVQSGKGLKEMNERFRRRIREVKEYIFKMESENKKIQDAYMTTTNHGFRKNDFYSKVYTEYGSPSSPTWLQKIQSTAPYKRVNHDYYDGLRRRLQVKQEQAWERVRRQQEQIDNRNARSLINFGRGVGVRSHYLSPKYTRF